VVGKIRDMLRDAVLSYVADNCLSRGAAIAYYTVFALAPVLLIVIAVAGLLFGSDEARGAVVAQVTELMGKPSADAIQTMLKGAAHRGSGMIATVVGVVTLLVAASGVFSEMQAALNAIWRAKPREGAVWGLLRTRLVSLGLVLTLGLLLMVSLIVSAGLGVLGGWVTHVLPGAAWLLRLLNILLSFVLIALLFAAIYRFLPDTEIAWRDVGVGAVVTAALMAVGKYAIALYVGSSSISTTYGAAGTLAVLFVWIYYSSQIFLIGAELTRCFATTFGTWRDGAPASSLRGHAEELAGLRRRLASSRPGPAAAE
jgi:membrane protein